MTVKELIEKLQNFPPDKIVCASQPFCGHEDLYEITGVHDRGSEVGISLGYYDYDSRVNPSTFNEDGSISFNAFL